MWCNHYLAKVTKQKEQRGWRLEVMGRGRGVDKILKSEIGNIGWSS